MPAPVWGIQKIEWNTNDHSVEPKDHLHDYDYKHQYLKL
jgi:hypothetical protein